MNSYASLLIIRLDKRVLLINVLTNDGMNVFLSRIDIFGLVLYMVLTCIVRPY